MMNSQPVLALDAGGSSIKSALVEKTQHVVGNVCIDTIHSQASAAEIFNTLAMIIRSHLQVCSDLKEIAFAFPGPFDYEQGICLIQNQDKYDALYGLDISANLREILGSSYLEIRYRNDAEAAILGEALYGVGMPYSRLLGVSLGTGLGSAFIANGTCITEGPTVPEHGWLYSFLYGEQRADDLFSTRGLLARLRAYGIDAVNIESALNMADQNQQALADAFASFGADLGAFLTPFVSKFRAKAVLVTGGIAEAWEHFSPSLSRSLPIPARKGTLGNRAALLGAAALYV